ncbi:hypothetical protein ACIBH1_27005 [Nonomuraea sp. NPDC050663]|uniref:hypothetical protein n=1 Tax=Nonomuraea sp. NPDC050663 TaxID=3364370 RepID=UPI003787EBF1
MAVALTMARMKVSLLRHSLKGPMTSTGVLLGVLLAGWTLYLALTADPAVLAGAYAVWMLGWMLGPLFMGGGDESLRPEHFSLLGIKSHRLASGLLVAAFIGMAPLISLVASLGLVISGVRQSPAGALIAVVAIVLQLALFVLVSRVAVALLGLALRSRLGAVGAGLLNGAILGALCQIWVFLALFDQSGVPQLVWQLPSGWGLLAVNGEPGRLVALAVLDLVLLGAWAALLSRRAGAPRTSGRPRRAVTAHGALGGVFAKELRTWTRDLVRNYQVIFSLSFGVCFGASPLLLGWDGMLPYAGPIFVVMAASLTSNLYGSDGTALWLTLLTPRASDVRGRQLAWLAAVGPAAAAVTVVTAAVAGGPWPLVLALLAAMLGGAAGLIPLVSVYGLVPGTDPHRRGGNPLRVSDDNGGLTGLAYLMLALVVASGVPAGLVALSYGWAGVPVGLATGFLSAWGLGLLAERRLRERGVELLQAMRTGRRVPVLTPAGPPQRVRTLPKTAPPPLAALLFLLGAIPLFPQGIVAGIFVANGVEGQSWFLATYLAPGLRWPAVGGMVVLGLILFGVAAHQTASARRRGRALPHSRSA